MTVKELLNKLSGFDMRRQNHYMITYAIENYGVGEISGDVCDVEYSIEDKMVTISNNGFSEKDLHDLYESLSKIDNKEAEVVFGHYACTGEDQYTLISANEYEFEMDTNGFDECVKFKINCKYLNI